MEESTAGMWTNERSVSPSLLLEGLDAEQRREVAEGWDGTYPHLIERLRNFDKPFRHHPVNGMANVVNDDGLAGRLESSSDGASLTKSHPSAACPRSQRSAYEVRGHIYKWTSPSGKGYVGQSKRAPRVRINEHSCDADNCYGIRHAIKKYGKDRMKYEILIDDVELEDLDRLEQEMQDLHRTLKPHGYNQCRVGQMKDKRGSARNHLEKCKEAMETEENRERVREQWRDPKFRAKQDASRRRVHGGVDHVAQRRAVFEAKRKAKEATMTEPERMVHAEFARRDAVQSARKTIRKGSHTPDREPMAEVIATYGDGSAWKEWKAKHPDKAREAIQARHEQAGRTAGGRKRTADTMG